MIRNETTADGGLEDGMGITKKKTEAQIWFTAHILTSFTQLLFFTFWVISLAVFLNAPFWAWLIGCCYVVSHWTSFVVWFMANMSMNRWTEAAFDKAADVPTNGVERGEKENGE